jgi:branched-subunit amino acid aminotransferase/4-amino-4-deoxychorismate lyase
MSVESIFRWHDGQLVPLDYCDMSETTVLASDSWFVTGGTALAIGLHRARFFAAVDDDLAASIRLEQFWAASIALTPREGEWFPRVDLQLRSGAPLLVFRLRSAPDRTRDVAVATWDGADPRTTPLTKGPDLAALSRVRTSVQSVGAGEAILLSPEGYLIEGAYSGLLWWRGNILCSPPAEFDRIDSVTVRSVLGLATALGIETYEEAVTPAEIDGVELWSLSALHGPRIVTRWVDGPDLAELPGRLGTWRARMDALRKPI